MKTLASSANLKIIQNAFRKLAGLNSSQHDWTLTRNFVLSKYVVVFSLNKESMTNTKHGLEKCRKTTKVTSVAFELPR